MSTTEWIIERRITSNVWRKVDGPFDSREEALSSLYHIQRRTIYDHRAVTRQVPVQLPLVEPVTDNRETKEAAIALVEEHHPASTDDVYAIIEQLAATGKPFTADDVWPRLVRPLSSVYTVGAAFNRASRRKLIVYANLPWTHSKRPQNNGHPLPYWIGNPVPTEG